MTERPIIFSAEMILALLEGRKTMTRRLMKPQPSDDWFPDGYGEVHRKVNGEPDVDKIMGWGPSNHDGYEAYACPFGKPGDRLVVAREIELGSHIEKSVPSILLEITGVRVERVQEISEADAIAEGCPAVSLYFKGLWNSIHGDGAWERNEYVWVISFKRIKP